jgi:serine protease Do
VEEVTPGSSGDEAGIRTGDFLLTADGETLSTSQDLLRIRRQHYLGDQMPVTLWRNGEILEATMVMKDPVEAEETVPWYVNP